MADDRPARGAPREGRARRPVGVPARRREPRLTRTRSRAGSDVAATGGFLGVSSTRRAAVLAVVVCAIALTVSVPLRNYVAQQQELAAVTAQQQALQREVDALAAEQARLADPAVVAAEARSRLGYASPGEIPYVVQLPQGPAEPEVADRFRDQPWYDRLWREVREGRPS